MSELFQRRKTRVVKVRDREIGGSSPILVQSMTNTDTEQVEATCEQIDRLVEAGCELVRVAVPDMKAAKMLGKILDRSPVPVAADIHFDWRLALEALEQGIDKLRINPGNLRNKDKLKEIVSLAQARSVPIRIGVNAGSINRDVIKKCGGVTPLALVESALSEIRRLEALEFREIVISMKSFDIPLMIEAHRILAREVDYPFHIGVTESGTRLPGSIRSAVGIGCLLMEGMGDTVRVSLTSEPCEEVKAAYEILKALGLRKRGPTIISCPTCGRTKIDILRLVEEVEFKTRELKTDIKIAVMGCVVNGPGEARLADVGVAGGKGEGVLFRGGEVVKKVKEEEIVNQLMEEIEKISRERSEDR